MTLSRNRTGITREGRASRRAAHGAPLLAAVWIAHAAIVLGSDVEVRLVDGRRLAGQWIGWRADDGLELRASDGRLSIPAEDLLSVTFAAASAPAAIADGWARLHLHEGGRVDVRVGEPRDGVLLASTDAERDLSIPFAHIAAIQFQEAGDCPDADMAFRSALAARRAGEDVIISCEQAEVHTVGGALESLSAEVGRFQHENRSRTFQAARIYAVVLALPAARSPIPPCRATMTSGEVWTGTLLDADNLRVTLRTPFGASVALDLDRIAGLEFTSDRFVYVSDLAATLVREEGRLLTPQAHRRDRSASNTALKIAGRAFARGIGAHSYSELTYALEGAYHTFYAVIGLDDAVRPRGSVVFRVLADGDVRFDSGVVTGRDEPREVRLDVEGARELTLIVDYGDGLDVADQADWADARLIKPPRTVR